MGAISLGASHLLYFTKAQSKGFLTLHTTTAAAPSQKGRRRRLQTIRCEYSDGKFREQGPPFHRSFDSVESGDFYFTSSKDTARSERDGRTTDLNAVQCPDRSTSAKKSDSRWRAWMGDQTGEETKNPILRLFRAATCAILAAGVVVFQSSDPSAWAEEVKVTFPGSKISEVMTVQRTMVEAWGIVRETFVDTSFNNQNWDLLLQKSLTETLAITSPEDVYSKIKTMLSSLGDPFTRIITPKEYESFRINSDGALEGVGLLIASERETGRLIVMSPIEGGPAARAGIISGDELVQIDDQVLTGLNGDDVATKLRGRAGTSVTLILRRPVTNPGMPNGEPLEFKLRRETVTLNPVFSAVLPHPLPNGQLVKTGYIRLAAFSQNAAREMARTISSLEAQGVDSYILDLRNNPGGLVKAGLDVAQMWLNGTGVLVNTIDRDGYTQPVTLVNGHSLTSDPLVVLVNESSASASEILAGALHDNGRALLVGEKTFGKGKIQSVTELTDGSALFVTVAKYLSPRFHEIDRVGIAPDLKCNLEIIPGLKDPAPTPPPEEQLVLDPRTKVDQRSITNLQRDSCIRVAEYELDISS